MTPEIKGLLLTSAKVGHRTEAGHHANTTASLLSIIPEHENHARRQLSILAVQTAGLAKALARRVSPATARRPG